MSYFSCKAEDFNDDKALELLRTMSNEEQCLALDEFLRFNNHYMDIDTLRASIIRKFPASTSQSRYDDFREYYYRNESEIKRCTRKCGISDTTIPKPLLACLVNRKVAANLPMGSTVMFIADNGTYQSYEPDVWIRESNNQFRFRDSYVGPIDIPPQIRSCDYMFEGCDVKEGCYLRNFDTKWITSMHAMFKNASLPKGFSLGLEFDTTNVRDMTSMFESAKFPREFNLGSKFNTRNVLYCNRMFHESMLPNSMLSKSGMLELRNSTKRSDIEKIASMLTVVEAEMYDFKRILSIDETALEQCSSLDQLYALVKEAITL